MEQIPLTADPRAVIGRKVKTLRKEGLIPAHVFGHKIATVNVQVKASDFKKVFEKAGETGIINLSEGGKSHPVLIRNVQIHPVSDEILHVDFYEVNLSEKVTVNVPLEIIGEAPAVEKKIGLLLTPIAEVEIEALPADIPENIEVDISGLQNIDDAIKVSELKFDRAKIELKAEEDLVVAQIGELVTKEMEQAEAEAEAAAEAASAETVEGAEGTESEEAKVEGEESVEGGEESQKSKEDKQEENKKDSE